MEDAEAEEILNDFIHQEKLKMARFISSTNRGLYKQTKTILDYCG
jgi:hypothetical protein